MLAPRSLRLSRISPPLLTAALCTLAIEIACPFTLAGTAEAAWSAPQKIVTKQAYARPHLARDAKGDAVLVWHFEEAEDEGSLNKVVPVEASTRVAGQGWSAPQLLEPCCRTSLAVAMDSRGQATLAWERFVYNPDHWTVETLTHPLGGSWSAASRASPRGVEANDPQLSIAPSGEGVLAFSAAALEPAFVRGLRIERREPPAGWHAIPLATGVAGDEVRLAGDRRGESIVAVSDPERHRVQLVILDRNGHPEGPIESFRSGGRGYATELDLVADQRGDAALVWRDTGPRLRPVFVATRPAGGRFATPVRIGGGIGMEPVVAIDGRARATVIFANQTGHDERPLEVSRQVGGRRWSRPRPLVRAGRFVAPQLGATASGYLIAVWSREGVGVIEAASTTPSGSWLAPTPLSAAGAGAISLAIAGDGATAAWDAAGGFETSDYTP